MSGPLPVVDGPWPGKLTVLPRPRGGDWLEDEIRGWKLAGIGAVVSLLTNDEEADLDLTGESELVQRSGMQFLSYPITDFSVPSSRENTAAFVKRLGTILAQGDSVVVHCRGGLGR